MLLSIINTFFSCRVHWWSTNVCILVVNGEFCASLRWLLYDGKIISIVHDVLFHNLKHATYHPYSNDIVNRFELL